MKEQTREFLDYVCPKMHLLEAEADKVVDYAEKKKIWAITEPIRAEVCRITDKMEAGREAGERIREIKYQIRQSLQFFNINQYGNRQTKIAGVQEVYHHGGDSHPRHRAHRHR